MNGILLVDKPRGWTSFDAVNKVRRLIQYSPLNETAKKRFPVGHTGTLDPLATGLLVLLLGKYTKQAPALTKLDKTYEVTLRLGEMSTTGDEEGVKTVISHARPPLEEVQRAVAGFIGDSLQTPPAYSAIKVDGQRAYKLARQGREVRLEPRPVRIYSITGLAYHYPEVSLTVQVSSGTYIRSLVEDIGKALHTGAYMTALRRTTVGPFTLEGAVNPELLTLEKLQESYKTPLTF